MRQPGHAGGFHNIDHRLVRGLRIGVDDDDGFAATGPVRRGAGPRPAPRSTFATLTPATAIVGAALHGTLQTTDAFAPGTAPSDQPVRVGDGVLHVRAGETVTVTAPGAERLDAVARAAAEPPASDVSAGWLRTKGRNSRRSMTKSSQLLFAMQSADRG